MKIILVASEQDKIVNVSYEDLGLTKEQYQALSDIQKLQKLDEYVGQFDQPYWDITKLPTED